MQRTRAVNNDASLPAQPTLPNSPGYFVAGTFADFGWFNSVQEEIAQFIEAQGLTLDKDNYTQLGAAVAVLCTKGIVSAAPGTGAYFADDPTNTRFLVGTATSQVKGAQSGCIASSGCISEGNDSAALASDDCVVGVTTPTVCTGALASQKMSATGNESAVIASQCTDSGRAAASGARSAALASRFDDDSKGPSGTETLHAASVDSAISGAQSAALATGGCIVSGDVSLAAAAALSTVSGDESAVIATVTATQDGDRGAIIGGTDNESDLDGSVIAASEHSRLLASDAGVARTNKVMLASRYAKDDYSAGYTVSGGYTAGSTPTSESWLIDSDGGSYFGDGSNLTGLDYAEMFQNGDGAAHEPGRIITRVGRTARLAQPGARILGVVSVHPTIVGGGDELAWAGRYARDEWGRRVREDVEQVDMVRDPAEVAAWKARRRDLDAEAQVSHVAMRLAQQARRRADKALAAAPADPALVEAQATAAAEDVSASEAYEIAAAAVRTLAAPGLREVRRPVCALKPNPAWNPERAHAPRSTRPAEWTCVGLLGQLRVAVDASVRPDDDVVAGIGGLGTLGAWVGRGAQLECMAIETPFDAAKGYAVALCLLR